VTAIAPKKTSTIGAEKRMTCEANVGRPPASPVGAGGPSAGTIGHRSKRPGSTSSMHTSVASTPIAAWKPNTRIGSSSLTTSDPRPIAVVPADRVQGSQPSRTARAATPARPAWPAPSPSDSTR